MQLEHRNCKSDSQSPSTETRRRLHVGTLGSESFSLSVLSDPQKHTAFDPKPREKLPKLRGNTEAAAVGLKVLSLGEICRHVEN